MILLRDWLSSLRSHVRYAREASETTCKRNVAKTTRYANLQRKMTDKDETDLETLLKEDDLPSTQHDDTTLAKVLQSINNSMANLANSLSNMNEAFAEIRHTPPATAKRDSRAVEPEALSSDKKRRANHSKDDSDVETLIEGSPEGTSYLGRLEAESGKSKEAVEEDDFLTTLALEYSADDKTCSPVSPQLAVDEQQIHQPSEKAGRGQQEVTAIDNEILTKLTNIKVNEFLTFLPALKQHFTLQIHHFKGDRLAHFCHDY